MAADNKSKLTKDALYERYIEQGKTAKEIADEFGVTPTAVYNACYKFGFKRSRESGGNAGVKGKDYRNLFPKNILHELYIVQNKTIEQTAEALHTNTSVVYKLLHEYGIKKSRAAYNKGRCPSKSELKKLMKRYDNNASAIAKHMGVTRMTVYNWIRQNGLSTNREQQSSRDKLHELAVDKHMTLGEIASELNCAERVAKKNLEANGFELYIA